MQDHLSVPQEQAEPAGKGICNPTKISISNNVFPEKEAEWFPKNN